MAFTRKFWKRGDKLNAKELNRIEEGIAEKENSTSTATVVTFSITGERDNGYNATSFSIEPIEILNKVKNNEKFQLIGIKSKGDEGEQYIFDLKVISSFPDGIVTVWSALGYELSIELENNEINVSLHGTE